MACSSVSTIHPFILAIRNHFEKEGVDLSQVATLEIECKHKCQVHFIQETLLGLHIKCTSDTEKKILQSDISFFFDASQDDNVETKISCITLSVEKTKEIVKRSFPELVIAKHDKKFYKKTLKDVYAHCVTFEKTLESYQKDLEMLNDELKE